MQTTDTSVNGVKRFSSMDLAFAYIREKNAPEVVDVEFDGTKNEKPMKGFDRWKLYPSGKAVQV